MEANEHVPGSDHAPPASALPRLVPFPMHEIHVARFGGFARTTVFGSSGLRTAAPAVLPATPMHPAFVYTSGVGSGSGPDAAALAAVSPSFQPISCHVSPVVPFDAAREAAAAAAAGAAGGPPSSASSGASLAARPVAVTLPLVEEPSAGAAFGAGGTASTTSSLLPTATPSMAPIPATAPSTGVPTVVWQATAAPVADAAVTLAPEDVATGGAAADQQRRPASAPGASRESARAVDAAAQDVPARSASTRGKPSVSRTSSTATDSGTGPSGEERLHVLSVSSNNHLLGIVAASGYWNTVEVPLGQLAETESAAALAMHAFERHSMFNFADVVAGKVRPARGPSRTGVSNVIVAVTVITNRASPDGPDESSNSRHALHIYGASSNAPTLERKLFALAGDCQIIPLDYEPLQVGHIEIHHEGREPMAICVTDTAGELHLYAEVPSTRKFQAVETAAHFPDLVPQQSALTHLTTFEHRDARYLALGYGSGELQVVVDHRDSVTHTFDRSRQRTFQYPLFYTPITAIEFLVTKPGGTEQEDTREQLNLLIVAASEPALVFRGICADGSGWDAVEPHTLLLSDQFDSVLCACVARLRWTDGKRDQLLLGTYGQRVLMYDFDSISNQYQLVSVKKMAYPVHAMYHADMTGDGLRELVVASLYSLHILQHDMDEVLSLLRRL
ncbi:hypothetical protein H9P43_005316 [Blastocladiella emersonii ATCC 22665]|nr:hypothetical protein H9P43_005287 [Blastocladiella emersonii ATCC 22665]KAI9179984.1 hypothetical protein H9P43_005316 [Blastocladiella emersonii ATCC 22665]